MGLVKAKGQMYTWVTHMHAHLKGACSHRCCYCYAPKGDQRRQATYSGPVYLDEAELSVNYKGEKKRVIFIDHMNDLWAEAVPAHAISLVLRHCATCLDNVYVFQTKNPERYLEFMQELVVLNRWTNGGVMLGATVETNRELPPEISLAPPPINRLVTLTNLTLGTTFAPFITIEPVLDFDVDDFLKWLIRIRPQFVNIGADSKDCHLPEPPPFKVQALIKGLWEAGIEIREKHNLDRLLNAEAKDLCPVCGYKWDDHDFGVPHPMCPAPALPGKSWGTPNGEGQQG